MNPDYCIIIDLLPHAVEIDGEDHEINADFRTGILLEQLFADRELARRDKLAGAVALYYPHPPQNLREALRQIIWFHGAGKEKFSVHENAPEKPKPPKPVKRILDYEIDAPLIYAAFLSQYQIDLQDVDDLHWWKFHALLNGLKDDLPLSRIMMYRGIDLNTIKDRKMRRQYSALQAKYKLPSLLSEQQKIGVAGQMFAPRGIRK